VRTEEVPWARPRARHTRDFQDVVAWLAQHTDKTTITKLLRVSWEAVAQEGRGVVTLETVYDELGDERLKRLQVATLDMDGAYEAATLARTSHLTQCVDPFHVVKLANDAIDRSGEGTGTPNGARKELALEAF
jgi:transposase